MSGSPPTDSSLEAELRRLATERVLVLDGAMGTQIQDLKLSEEAFRAERFKDWPQDLKGNNDLLVLTQPDAVRDIHLAYFRAAPISSRRTASPRRDRPGRLRHAGRRSRVDVAAARLAREAAAIEPGQQMGAPPVDGQPHDGECVDDGQAGAAAPSASRMMAITAMYPSEGMAGPGEVGQALPRQQEGGRHQQQEEQHPRHRDLAAGVVWGTAARPIRTVPTPTRANRGSRRSAATRDEPRGKPFPASGRSAAARVDRGEGGGRLTCRGPIAVAEPPHGLNRAIVRGHPTRACDATGSTANFTRDGREPAGVVPGQLDQLVRRQDLALVAGQRGQKPVLGRGQPITAMPSTVTSWWAKSMQGPVVEGGHRVVARHRRRLMAWSRAISSTRLNGLVR